jgi:phage shock protein A
MNRSKQEKRQEALARKAERAKRTPQQQLAKLDQQGHSAKKERARLRATIAKLKEKFGGDV